jgi:hypothetical protein
MEMFDHKTIDKGLRKKTLERMVQLVYSNMLYRHAAAVKELTTTQDIAPERRNFLLSEIVATSQNGIASFFSIVLKDAEAVKIEKSGVLMDLSLALPDLTPSLGIHVTIDPLKKEKITRVEAQAVQEGYAMEVRHVTSLMYLDSLRLFVRESVDQKNKLAELSAEITEELKTPGLVHPDMVPMAESKIAEYASGMAELDSFIESAENSVRTMLSLPEKSDVSFLFDIDDDSFVTEVCGILGIPDGTARDIFGLKAAERTAGINFSGPKIL